MKLYTLPFLLAACATENQIIDSNTCDAHDGQAADPVVYVNQCPEVNLTCPDIPECPDVNVVCPEPEVVVELVAPEPQVNVNVEAPSVTVTNDVEAPDFSDLVTAIEDLALSSSSLGVQYYAQTGFIQYASSSNPGTVVFTNNESTDFILTSMLDSNNDIDCDLEDSAGNIIMDNMNASGMFRKPSGNCCGNTGSAYTQKINIVKNMMWIYK